MKNRDIKVAFWRNPNYYVWSNEDLGERGDVGVRNGGRNRLPLGNPFRSRLSSDWGWSWAWWCELTSGFRDVAAEDDADCYVEHEVDGHADEEVTW